MRIFGLHILTNKQMEENDDTHKKQCLSLLEAASACCDEDIKEARDHQRQISTAMVSEMLADNHRLKEQLRKKVR